MNDWREDFPENKVPTPSITKLTAGLTETLVCLTFNKTLQISLVSSTNYSNLLVKIQYFHHKPKLYKVPVIIMEYGNLL